ncbi:MAG TPA: hypothetical protein VN679_13315, partial [Candidatus Acidoferrales bacterium]|nr:hypothetical protein [Candidatus Acidoferrales bacterium]
MFRFLHRKANRWLLLLAAVDMVLLGFSLNAAMFLRYFSHPDDFAKFSRHMPERSLAFAVIMLLAMVALGHYQSHMRTSWFGVLARQSVGFVLGGMGVFIMYYMLPQAYVGRGVLIIALLLAFALMMAFRMA